MTSRPDSLEQLLACDLSGLEAVRRVVIGELMKRHSGRVVIFGAGPFGRLVAGRMLAAGHPVGAFCDNAPGKWGTVIDTIPVISPEEALRSYRDHLFVVTIIQNRT